jgi:hypothetical protein
MNAIEEREHYQAVAAKVRYWRLIGESVPATFVLESLKAMFDEMRKGLAEAGPIDPRAVAILTAALKRAEKKVVAQYQTFVAGISSN